MTSNPKSQIMPLKTPMIYCYSIYGAIFSIIDSKDMPWVYGNFMQIMYHDNWEMIIFEDNIVLLETIPFLKTQYLAFGDKKKPHACIDTLINALAKNHYLYLFLDWHYILPDMEHHLAHPTLISGYDIEKHIFYLSDNYEAGKYKTLEVDMEAVEQAFYSAWTSPTEDVEENDGSAAFEYLKTITAFKYEKEIYAKFDTEAFISSLKAYLNSESTLVFAHRDKSVYGVSVYGLVNDVLTGKADYRLQLKNFHLLYEHKYMMKKRIEFLISEGIISEKSEYLQKAEYVCNEFLLIRNKYLKMLMYDERLNTDNRHAAAKKELAEKINNAAICEDGYLKELLHELEKRRKFKAKNTFL